MLCACTGHVSIHVHVQVHAMPDTRGTTQRSGPTYLHVHVHVDYIYCTMYKCTLAVDWGELLY